MIPLKIKSNSQSVLVLFFVMIVFFAISVAAFGKDQLATVMFHPSAYQITQPQQNEMTVYRTTKPPDIDGIGTDPCWQKAMKHWFVKASGAGKLRVKSWIKICYDSKNLYIFFHAQRPENFSKAKATKISGRDNVDIFRGSPLQIFLQPSSSKYYQIAINHKGNIFDLSISRVGRQWGEHDVSWNARGMKTAGTSNQHQYTIEVSIPFLSLGIKSPPNGAKWRGDFFRNERSVNEKSAWVPTGGSFHSTSLYGFIKFSSKVLPPHPQNIKDNFSHADHTVIGQVLRPDGKPAPYVMVSISNHEVRTDQKGMYKFDNIEAGKQIIYLNSPRYHNRSGYIRVKHKKQKVTPITLQPIDQYKAHFRGPIGKSAVTWLKTSIDTPFDMDTTRMPSTQKLANQLSFLATPGQYESRAIAIYSNQSLIYPMAKIVWNNGNTAQVTSKLYWVDRVLDRQYDKPRRTAVFTWKFLQPTPPPIIRSGHVRMLAITLHVPKNTFSGKQSGKLVLYAGGKQISTIPIELTIPDFKLIEPVNKKLGIYYRNWNPYYPKGVRDRTNELRDIRKHGCQIVLSSSIGLTLWENSSIKAGKPVISDGVTKRVKRLNKLGFTAPYMVALPYSQVAALAKKQNKISYHDLVGAIANKLKRIEKNLHTQSLVIHWSDEIYTHTPTWLRFAKAIRPLLPNKIYITIPISTGKKYNQWFSQVDPYIDIRSYNGWSLDKWLVSGHYWNELKSELEKSGDQAWVYYNDIGTGFTPEDQRLTTGYWFWNSPLSVSIPWTYIFKPKNNNPFKTLDKPRGDQGFVAYNSQGKLIGTLDWIAYRQGYNDMCYLATLKKTIKNAKQSNFQAKRALGWLRHLRKEIPKTLTKMADKLSPEIYTKRRLKITRMINLIVEAEKSE